MKSLRIMILAVVLALAGTTLADNLSVGGLRLVPGQTKQLTISLANPQKAYAAFQLDLVLPEGITVVRDEAGHLMAALCDERKADHVLSVSHRGGGVYRLMAFSMSNSPFAGTEGALVSVTLHADERMEAGTVTGSLQQQVMTEQGGTQQKWADLSFAIDVERGGDHFAVEPIVLMPGQTKQLAISLENPLQAYAAFQLDLVLPAGITVARNDAGKLIASLADDRKGDHVLNVTARGDGTYRLMAFSMSNAAFSGQEGPLAYVALQADAAAASGELAATLLKPVVTQADGTQQKWADVSFTITVDGEVIMGDVNGDGRVNISDATMLARRITGETLMPYNAAAANVSGDDAVSIADVVGIVEMVKAAAVTR